MARYLFDEAEGLSDRHIITALSEVTLWSSKELTLNFMSSQLYVISTLLEMGGGISAYGGWGGVGGGGGPPLSSGVQWRTMAYNGVQWRTMTYNGVQ